MKRLYVVRGLGFNNEEVWIGDFRVTMLRQCEVMDNSWFSIRDWEDNVTHGGYDIFHALTGITLEPGEYTRIAIVEVS